MPNIKRLAANLRVGFALSKRTHLHRAYLVSGPYSFSVTVYFGLIHLSKMTGKSIYNLHTWHSTYYIKCYWIKGNQFIIHSFSHISTWFWQIFISLLCVILHQAHKSIFFPPFDSFFYQNVNFTLCWFLAGKSM